MFSLRLRRFILIGLHRTEGICITPDRPHNVLFHAVAMTPDFARTDYLDKRLRVFAIWMKSDGTLETGLRKVPS